MNKTSYSMAAASDLADIQACLSRCDLSVEGIEAVIEHCLVARAGSKMIGTIAVEPCGRSGLLRSLAVIPEARRQAVGRNLCAKAISHARLLGIERLYLLTTTAEGFFGALGFERQEWTAAPPEIQQTAQFRSVCPKSAVCMVRDIRREPIHASNELLQLKPDVPGARMWAVALKHTMLTYFEVDANSRFDAHSHESEQITMVLSGELFFDVAGVVHRIRAGEVIAIPASVPHSVWTELLAVTAVDAWSPVMRKYGAAKG